MECLKKDVLLVADFIAWKFVSKGSDISVLKLQKLLYYVEAWHTVLKNKVIFTNDFEAWAHGPVCKDVFIKYRHTYGKTMYDVINEESLTSPVELAAEIDSELENHIDNVLEIYGQYTGVQLEHITHNEKPWLEARGALGPYEKSSNVINKELMRDFYKELLAQG